jgi:hypothetical protein
MIDIVTGKPYINVMFGNFYSPAYDDERFVDDTMQLIKRLGYNSVMLDTKAWEDFKERYETGTLQEYMEQSALKRGLSYNFLVLYLNGDNLYPHIRFSPPIYGEEVVNLDQTPGKWYKYWSEKAKISMEDHVNRIFSKYGDGCTVCEVDGKSVIPVCSMWDPIVAPSFDEEGIERYVNFLRMNYQNDIHLFNVFYETDKKDFSEIRPEEYWYPFCYDTKVPFTEEDAMQMSKKFILWRDNLRWKKQELGLYFKDMYHRLKKQNPSLFLCPDMTQWGYFLNIDGNTLVDHDADFSELWDTAVRGIDIYALAEYVDSCHFITVPTTPDGYPDAYVTSCQHSMMRVMNEGRSFIGGIYWGRFLYNDLYAQLTPAEMIGTMVACGIDGYTSYGINGLDDGGVLNRMEDSFLESLRIGNEWCADVIPRISRGRRKEIAILFPLAMSDYEPYEVEHNKVRRLDLLGWYKACCDLGYQVDVISNHEIRKGLLKDYKVLIIPSNDCYFAEPCKETEHCIRLWVEAGGIVLHGPKDDLIKACFGIEGRDCKKTPYRYDVTIIPQGVAFQSFDTGESIAPYVDEIGTCVACTEVGDGKIYSFGVQIGSAYAAKNIPHVPYDQNNKEMYPILQAKTNLLKDILVQYIEPASGIIERGIEIGVFENGKVIVNHRSTPYVVQEVGVNMVFQYPNDAKVLLPHSAVWVQTCITSD